MASDEEYTLSPVNIHNTIRPEINSNDFGLFWKKLFEFESNFVVAGILNMERFEFSVCLGFLCCVPWLVFTRGQTHSTDTAQHRYTQHSHITVLFLMWLCP